AAFDRHPEPATLLLEEGARLRELAARRNAGGEVDLAADLALARPQGAVVAAARRHPGRLQPCRATADHQHAPAHRRRRECSLPPLRFPTRGGVHETGHRLVELDHRDAALVAGDARPDLVEPTG